MPAFGTVLFATGAAVPQCGQCAQPRSKPFPHCVQVGRSGVAQFGQNVNFAFTDAPQWEQ